MSRRSTAERPVRSRRSDTTHDVRRRRTVRGFLVFCCAVVTVCAFLKLPSLRYPFAEGDERIYWQLAENLAHGRGYTLQGTTVLRELSPDMYDRPLFHHPPLFPALLTPFVLTGTRNAAVLISWLGHFLTVIAVALVGRHALLRLGNDTRITAPAFWLPVVAASADPLLIFVSRRLWIDSLAGGLAALAIATVLIAGGKRRRALLAAGGALLGLAALAKLTTLILVPVCVLAGTRADTTGKERAISIAAMLLPAAVLVAPWMLLFYQQYGVLAPSWVKPDARLMELFPFVRAAVDRPWYYYGAKLALIMPLSLIAVWLVIRERELWRDAAIQTAAAWLAIFVGVLTFLGIDGYGFQMRHITPAIAAIYVIVLVALLERERPILLMACGLSMLVGTVTGAMHLLVPEFDEIVSLLRIAGFAAF
jgi:hypothetical protein